MSFSVIIPSKTRTNLSACLDAADACEAERPDFVVIDDGLGFTRDEEIDLFIDRHVVMLEGEKPFIYARNVNLGLKYSFTPLTIEIGGDNPRTITQPPRFDGAVLMNDDALLQTPGGFTKLAAFAEAHPEVGVVAPATNITGQRYQWPQYKTPEGYRLVDTVPYICVYLPRRVIEKVGLLDERYSIDYGCEDLDHTTAMKRAGLKIAVLYDVFVDHGSLHSSFRGDPHTPKSFARNYALYKAKWGIA